MLRDYFWSMAFIAILLVAYTAIVIMNRKSPEITARAAASLKQPAAATIHPTTGVGNETVTEDGSPAP